MCQRERTGAAAVPSRIAVDRASPEATESKARRWQGVASPRVWPASPHPGALGSAPIHQSWSREASVTPVWLPAGSRL